MLLVLSFFFFFSTDIISEIFPDECGKLYSAFRTCTPQLPMLLHLRYDNCQIVSLKWTDKIVIEYGASSKGEKQLDTKK